MDILKKLIDGRIYREDVNFFNINEFTNLEKIDKKIHGTLKKANWENRKITVVLKNLNNSEITENGFEEFITKLRAFCKIDHSNINHFFGLTRDSNDNYFLISEYAIEGNLKNYLKIKFNTLQWDDKLQIALDITRGLMRLHSEKVIHGNLHSRNILVNNGMMMITDFRLLNQSAEVTSEYEVYVEPRYLRNPGYELDMKFDIYSLGILLWELASGRPPFFDYTQKAAQVENKLLNEEKEKSDANIPSEYLQLCQKCWQDNSHLRPKINEVYEILSQLELQSDISGKFNTQVIYNKNLFDMSSSPHTAMEIFESSMQQIIRQFKLNHGIVLNGHDIIPSLEGIVTEDGEIKVNLCEKQPLVYTSINSEVSDLRIDACVNFSIAEIIYNGNLLKSFFKYTNDKKKLRELHGDFLARKFLVGGKLFIKDINSATPAQIDILKFYLSCVYNSARYSIEIQSSNLFTLDLLPKLVTSDGEKINTYEKLTSWMNNLYQKKMVSIISYDNLILISRLRLNESLVIDSDLETFKEIQPGIVNFNEKLSLDEWVGNAVNKNLISWT